MSRTIALNRARTVKRILLAHGVPEVSIELQEGRPTYGADPWTALAPVAVMSHHIASHPSPTSPTPGLSLVKRGRSDLPGPLCNGTAGVDLVYRIICLGWANHSGEGGPMTVRGPLGAYLIPEDVGRPYIWGTEYEGGYDDAVWDREYTNPRTGKSMTFREFMGRANAGLVEAIWHINGKGKTPRPGMDLAPYHVEHGRPWALGRKPDRRGYVNDVTIGRNEIRRYANAGVTETDPVEELMSWYDDKAEFERAVAQAAAKGVLGAKRIATPDPDDDAAVTVDAALTRILNASVRQGGGQVDLSGVQESIDRLSRAVRASKVDVDAVAEAVAQRVPDASQETVAAAFRQVLSEGVG